MSCIFCFFFFFFQAEDGIRDRDVTGVQTCALPISRRARRRRLPGRRRRETRPGSSPTRYWRRPGGQSPKASLLQAVCLLWLDPVRSEERRVGKEGRSRRSAWHEKKKK